MKQHALLVSKRNILWLFIGILIIAVGLTWIVRAHRSSTIITTLWNTSILAAPASHSILLAQGSGTGFTNNETTQNPSVAKVYAVSGEDIGALVRYYEQTYPSYEYKWQADYYFPSPGVSATNLFGVQGAKSIAVYIGPAPYVLQYPALSLKHAPPGYTTYVTILVSEKR